MVTAMNRDTIGAFTMRLSALSLLLASSLATASSWAQPVDERARLQQGAEAAYRRGRHAEALDFAMRAGNLGMTPQLRLFIGVQHEALGHTVEALESAERCVREATSAPASAVREQVLDRCNQMVTALDRRVARVVVLTPDPAPVGLQVRMQGAELDGSRWRTPVAVLPGAVVVEAVSSAGLTLRREVTVTEGERVEVSLEEIAPRRPVVAPVTPPASDPAVQSVATQSPTVLPTESRAALRVEPEGPAPSSPTVAPWIVAASGGALAVVGASLILARDASVEARDEACPNMACDAVSLERATAADQDARAWQTASYVTMSVGAAVAVGGVIWGVVARRPRRSQTAQRPTFDVAVSPSAVGISATF